DKFRAMVKRYAFRFVPSVKLFLLFHNLKKLSWCSSSTTACILINLCILYASGPAYKLYTCSNADESPSRSFCNSSLSSVKDGLHIELGLYKLINRPNLKKIFCKEKTAGI